MKLVVKLYGTLGRSYQGYRHDDGMEVEIPEGTTVRELLARLKISESQRPAVIVEGRILRAEDEIPHRALVNIFQSIRGG